MEEEKTHISPAAASPGTAPRPLGLTILGAINLGLRGVLALATFLYAYFTFTPQRWQELLSGFVPQSASTALNLAHIKLALTLQIIMSLAFVISGVGLLKQKEWARVGTLYFSFALALLILLSVVFNPAFVAQAFIEIIYPGITIVYLTNRKVKEYFH